MVAGERDWSKMMIDFNIIWKYRSIIPIENTDRKYRSKIPFGNINRKYRSKHLHPEISTKFELLPLPVDWID